MKHNFSITLILIGLFFVAQVMGLFTVSRYITVSTGENGTITIGHPDTLIGAQPDIPDNQKAFNFVPIIIAVLIGTGLMFILIKFNFGKVWKLWFLIAVTISLAISFNVYVTALIAAPLAFLLALIRIYKPNVIIHNFTEIFIYTGITLLILPWLNLISAVGLLILISIYDMIAVWKSKHMIKLARFQIESKLFAGLSMNYNRNETEKIESKKGGNVSSDSKSATSNAILGGGDIAFPLLFAAAVMEHLILFKGVLRIQAFWLSLIISLFAGIALSALLFLSKKGKFYPAMPFISAGCFAGYAVISLLI